MRACYKMLTAKDNDRPNFTYTSSTMFNHPNRRVLTYCILAIAATFSGTSWISNNPAFAQTPASDSSDQRMQWWREARFGMFIHWGLYAVAAGEYQGKPIKGIGEWIMTRANIPRDEYE